MTTTRSGQTHDDLDRFETALLTELRGVVAERQPARRRTRVLTLGGVAASATAVLVGVGLAVGGSSPAFAVHQEADGDVVVTINRLDDSTGLEDALAAQGVTADVNYNHPIRLRTTDGKDLDVVPLTGTEGSPAPHAEAPSGALVQLGTADGGFDCSFGKGGYVTLDAVDDGYRVTIPRESVLADTPLEITTATASGHGTLAVSFYDGRCIEIAAPAKNAGD